MKKVALVFLLAVFVPSLVLAWLAIRSLRDQQFVLERQQSLLCQAVTDSFAREINDYLAEQQREFTAQVESFTAGTDLRTRAVGFDAHLRKHWPLAEVGFAVTLSGSLLSPSPTSSPAARMFCTDNGGFLGNRESVEVYWNVNAKGGNQFIANQAPIKSPDTTDQNSLSAQTFTGDDSAASNGDASVGKNNSFANPPLPTKARARNVNPAQQQAVLPAPDAPATDLQNISKVVSAEAEFHQLIGDAPDGMMARFLQNKLRVMFWHRAEKDPQLVFGAQLNLTGVADRLRLMALGRSKSNQYFPQLQSVNQLPGNLPEFNQLAPILPDEICLVVLDNNARIIADSDGILASYLNGSQPVRFRDTIEATFRTAFKTDLKHPFVATEVGEALPHWEVAAYLRNPDQFKHTARTLQLTFGLLIVVLLLAIGVGSWLIVNDLNRQLRLARQKTDFVSNVSHELKTPLTSIRMFSELLAEGRVAEPEQQRSYLKIITAETARLTRLINNVLDFARLERGEKKYTLHDCDLGRVVRETAESYRPHLENNGFKFECLMPETPLAVRGDADALAQIIVNLLANAEKYSNGQKEIRLELERRSPTRRVAGPTSPLPAGAETGAPVVELRVLDRGPGVPRGCEEKIFEQFYRADDSLSSGVPGSGLGLTLARQIARAHGGDVGYEPRAGGGSCFTLRLPLTPSLSPSDGERVAEGRERG